MEAFSALLAFCAGNWPVTSEIPAQGPVTRSFDVLFWSAPWINGWVNNNETGDLRRHCTHYDVTVMFFLTHVCIIQPRCVDSPLANTTYVHCWHGSLLVQIMGCCLFGVRPSTEPVMTSHQSNSEKHFHINMWSMLTNFRWQNYTQNYHL